MAVNLLTGEEVKQSDKPRNLLQDATKSIVPGTNENKPFLMDIGNAFMAGLSNTYSLAARVPAAVYDLAALPQNFLVKSIGRDDLQVKSPKWLMDNPVSEFYDYQTDLWRKEITPTKSLEESIATKDFSGIGRHIAIQVSENAPQQIGIILSYMAGCPTVGLAGMGLMEATGSLKTNRDAGVDPAISAYDSLAKGVIEAGFENIGTMGVLSKWSDVLTKSFGKKAAREVLGDVFKTIFYSMLGEGNEEFWTSLGQDFVDYTTGVNKNAIKGMLPRALEAGTVGAVSGGLMTGPSAVFTGAKSASLKSQQQKIINAYNATFAEAEATTPTAEAVETPTEATTAPKKPIVEGEGAITTQVEVAPAETTEKPAEPTKEEQHTLAKEEYKRVDDILKQLRRKINITDTDIKEELANLPVQFRTKEGGIRADEAVEEFNRLAGENIQGESELADRLEELVKQQQTLKERIAQLAPKKVTQLETTVAKKKLQNIQQGIRQGKVLGRQEVKDTQTEIVQLLKDSQLEAKDKAKFIATIKNTQTAEQLERSLPKMINRMAELERTASKTKAATKIAKELKRTKPLKQGQRKVGKYDYESNKFFDDLRAYNKMTQSQAQTELDSYPDDDNTEMDLLKKRFLSLKANGKSSSVELYEQVLKDIKTMKELGELAKDEADFNKRAERQERVDEALVTIEQVKGDAKSIKTKIVNLYRKGFSNIYSMFNSIGGKKFADNYNPELSENKRDTNVYYKTKAIIKEALRIYDAKNITRIMEQLAQKEYTITDIDGLTTELGKLELIDIYNSIKNDTVKERYYNAFGEAQVTSLLTQLTTKDVMVADMLQETIQEYREVFNQRNIEITGRDLGFVENYWPATSEYRENVYDDIRIQGETPSAMKERAKGKVIPKPGNAWYKAQRHIAQAEHVANLSREYETLKRLFSDRKVKHLIAQKFGEDVYLVLKDQIDNISLNARMAKIDQVAKWFSKGINNWVTAKVALNPSTFVRQLMSTGNYMEDMNSIEWTKLFFEGLANPKKTFDFMWQNAPFLEARFNRGYSEALRDAIEGAEKISPNWGNWSKFLSSFARAGDITAIVFGGYALAKTKGFKAFEQATLRSQQSGLSSSLSQFQNSKNPFARLFLAFKNTANQYFRKIVDAQISYSNGDIDLKQYSKTMAIYAVIQPILYALSGNLVKNAMKGLAGKLDDEWLEDAFDEMIIQLVVNPVNAVPLLSDLINYAMRKVTGQKAYDVINTPFLDDLASGISKLAKSEPDAKDYFQAIGTLLEPVTAIPANTYLRIYGYFAEDEEGGII